MKEKKQKLRSSIVIGLVLAELAFFISWIAYSASPLSAYINPVYLLPLVAMPFFRLKKDPFGFEFFGLLLIMHSAYILPGTEVFNSALDVLYFLGYKELSEYILSAFRPASSVTLPAVVLLFCISHVSERKEGIFLASAAAVFALLAYSIFTPVNVGFMAAIIAVGLIALSVYSFKAS